jgi:hypothetical protein
MRIAISFRCAFIAGLLCSAAAAHAHHSNTAYDTGKSVEWQAQVNEFKFVNPHAYVYFTMQDGSGKPVEGRCELGARTMLSRLGWTIDTFKPGEKVTLKGAPGRNEANVCLLNSFTRADGTVVNAHQQLNP